MKEARSPEQAMELLARENRWCRGPVPGELAGVAVPPGHHLIADGCFLLRCESGYGYLYEPGQGVIVERPEHADPDEEILWLHGTVYAAVAALNGFLPLHASAVAHDGRVIAFTGPTGAGKSTLAAALGNHGLPLFCDDTLLIDLQHPDQLICMPGHKRLKLLGDSLDLTGAVAQQPVGADTGKHYAVPPGGVIKEPLPLDRLVFLEQGPEVYGEPITGSERFTRLDDDHYTQDVFLEAVRPDRAGLFAVRARIAGKLNMARLIRPHSKQGFAASVELAAKKVGDWS